VAGKGATCAELLVALEAMRDENDTDNYEVWIVDPKRTAPITGRILIDEIRESVGIQTDDPADLTALKPGLDRALIARDTVLAEVERLRRERLT
jgi:hypothetical protein